MSEHDRVYDDEELTREQADKILERDVGIGMPPTIVIEGPFRWTLEPVRPRNPFVRFWRWLVDLN